MLLCALHTGCHRLGCGYFMLADKSLFGEAVGSARLGEEAQIL